MAKGQAEDWMILEAQMDATAKIMQALEAQRRCNTLMEAAARKARIEGRHTRTR